MPPWWLAIWLKGNNDYLQVQISNIALTHSTFKETHFLHYVAAILLWRLHNIIITKLSWHSLFVKRISFIRHIFLCCQSYRRMCLTTSQYSSVSLLHNRLAILLLFYTSNWTTGCGWKLFTLYVYYASFLLVVGDTKPGMRTYHDTFA